MLNVTGFVRLYLHKCSFMVTLKMFRNYLESWVFKTSLCSGRQHIWTQVMRYSPLAQTQCSPIADIYYISIVRFIAIFLNRKHCLFQFTWQFIDISQFNLTILVSGTSVLSFWWYFSGRILSKAQASKKCSMMKCNKKNCISSWIAPTGLSTALIM